MTAKFDKNIQYECEYICNKNKLLACIKSGYYFNSCFHTKINYWLSYENYITKQVSITKQPSDNEQFYLLQENLSLIWWSMKKSDIENVIFNVWLMVEDKQGSIKQDTLTTHLDTAISLSSW